jgi:ABC-type uncharacterized transport system auxiliary subunit
MEKVMTRSTSFLAIALLTISLGACIRVFPDPPPPPLIFALRADPNLSAGADPVPITLGIAAPSLTSVLAGSELAGMRQDGSYAYIKGVRWTAATPDALQSLLLETADRSNLVRSAVRTAATARSDYTLQFDVATFVLERSRKSGTAKIEGTARLIGSVDRRVIATKYIAVSGDAGLEGPGDAARALEAVAQTAALEAVTWASAAAKVDQLSKAVSAIK